MIVGELYELCDQDDHVFYVGITTVGTGRHVTHKNQWESNTPLSHLKRILKNKFIFRIVGRGNEDDERQLTRELFFAGHPILNTKMSLASRWTSAEHPCWKRLVYGGLADKPSVKVKLLILHNCFVWMTSDHVICWNVDGIIQRANPLGFVLCGGPRTDLNLRLETETEKRAFHQQYISNLVSGR
jgi:hypothetical protein